MYRSDLLVVAKRMLNIKRELGNFVLPIILNMQGNACL